MNPSSSGYWNNPPPPGTEFDDFEEASNTSSKKDGSVKTSDKSVDPYQRNPGREGDYASERPKVRSRSKSHDHDKRKKRRSRSRSRDRRRRSRSHSRRRRKKYSSSRSRSRSHSPGYGRRRRHRRRRRYSRSFSRSVSRSHSNSRSRSHRKEREKRSPKIKELSPSRKLDGDVIKEEDMKIEEEEDDEPETKIPFKNDGSFLEMFKRMQEQQQKAAEEAPTDALDAKKPALPVFGKRRGGKVLKTGMVQKIKTSEEDSGNAQDAWSVYMKEVRRYKEACCDDDSKTRPLVK